MVILCPMMIFLTHLQTIYDNNIYSYLFLVLFYWPYLTFYSKNVYDVIWSFTDAESTNTFTSWKQPPISSGNGEGNCTIILREFESETGITVQVVGGTGKATYKVMEQDLLIRHATLSDTGELKFNHAFDMELYRTNSITLVIRYVQITDPLIYTNRGIGGWWGESFHKAPYEICP